MKSKIGFIGAGNMGSAIIAGIHSVYDVAVYELNDKKRESLKQQYKIKTESMEKVVKNSDIVILAVKPQNMQAVLEQIKVDVKDQIVVSIAAGITTKYIENILEGKVKVVRTMPNLPAKVAQAVTGISAGKYAKKSEVTLVCEIFNCIGQTLVVSESKLDAITAVSGSGPAYVFQFIELLTDAAVSLGFNKKQSKELVLQTIKGSMALLEQEKKDAAVLRKRVTSKGGTTEAALEVFKKNRIDLLYQVALEAARQRAQDLSK